MLLFISTYISSHKLANSESISTTQPSVKEVFRPRQERSSRTKAAILQAARVMLAADGVESLTIAGVAARAGLTTGAFYARFRNKDALLQTLFEETLKLNAKTMAGFFSKLKASNASLAETIATFIPPALTLIRDNSALFRLFGSDHSTPVSEADRSILLLEAAIAPVAELLRQHTQEIPGREPHLSAAMLVLMVQGMVELSMHLRHSKTPLVPMDDERLADEISKAALGYLGLSPHRPERK